MSQAFQVFLVFQGRLVMTVSRVKKENQVLQVYLGFRACLGFQACLQRPPKTPLLVVAGGVFRALAVHPGLLVRLAPPVSKQASVSAVNQDHLGHQGRRAFLDFLLSGTTLNTASTRRCPLEPCW